jgi:predicted protein tyrosine phosphatase
VFVQRIPLVTPPLTREQALLVACMMALSRSAAVLVLQAERPSKRTQTSHSTAFSCSVK